MDLTELHTTVRRNAESARMHADTYARTGTRGGVVAGTGFYRRGGVDAAYLDELRRKADEAEQALRDLESMMPTLSR